MRNFARCGAYGVSIDRQFASELNQQRGGMDLRSFVRSQPCGTGRAYAQMTGQRMGMLDDRPRE
jgi:hypothetical protein